MTDEEIDSVGLKKSRRAKPAAVDLSRLDRLPPHSLEAEQGILGCVFLAPAESIGLCVEKLKGGVEAFYDLRHQTLYEHLAAMYDGKEPVDLITVQQRLKDAGQLEAVGGLPYLSGLMDAVPSAANLAYYLGIVREKHTLRRMLSACTQVIARVHEHEGEVDMLIDEVERDILAVSRDRHEEGGITSAKDLVRGAIDRIQRQHQSKGAVTGISTTLPELDRLTGGLHPGEMTVIAARPSVGKTTLAMQIAEQAAKDGLPVGVFSLEMTAESITDRRLIHESRVSGTVIREGALTEGDMRRLSAAAAACAKRPLHIDARSGLSILQIRERARRWALEIGVKLIVVDYLQLAKSTSRKGNDNRQVEISEISNGLKGIAKDLSIPIIVLSQLNRDCEQTNKAGLKRVPGLADLRESGAIEQDGDVILIPYSEADTQKEPREVVQGAKPVNLLLAKQRNGAAGETIRTVYYPALMRFEGASRVEA